MAVVVEATRDRLYVQTPVESRLMYVTSGRVAEKLALSYDALLADTYWIRALQQFGGDRLEKGQRTRYELLYPMLDVTTSLDPRFVVAYRFGAIFLSEPQPGGAGRPDLAIELLKKGIAAMPEKWDYYHDIGFIYYWNLHDYAHAAEWFDRGGNVKGAPWWLKTYAGVMLARGGNRQASRAMWQNLRQTTDSDWVRNNADLRLVQLDALDQIDALSRMRDEFSQQHGRLPGSWADLIRARLLRGVPVDPSGAAYVLDPATGRIDVSPSSTLHPLPVEPEARQP
jgi:tetratricopeptide (TPR) repeat protein